MLSIRKATYRDKEGFGLTGKHNGRNYKVFLLTREGAQKYKQGIIEGWAAENLALIMQEEVSGSYADQILAEVSSAIEILYNLEIRISRGLTDRPTSENDKALGAIRRRVRAAMDALTVSTMIPDIGRLRRPAA